MESQGEESLNIIKFQELKAENARLKQLLSEYKNSASKSNKILEISSSLPRPKRQRLETLLREFLKSLDEEDASITYEKSIVRRIEELFIEPDDYLKATLENSSNDCVSLKWLCHHPALFTYSLTPEIIETSLKRFDSKVIKLSPDCRKLCFQPNISVTANNEPSLEQLTGGKIIYLDSTDFCLDTIPYEADTDSVLSGVPKYRLETRVVVGDEDSDYSSLRFGNACFNCGHVGHTVNQCLLPRDEVQIAENIERFKEHNSSHSRYYVELEKAEKQAQMISTFQPGVLSDTLREALGIQGDQDPPYYNMMKQYGYPPGYLGYSEDDDPFGGLKSDYFDCELLLIDDEPIIEPTPDAFRKKKTVPLVKYPGLEINQPSEYPLYDYSAYTYTPYYDTYYPLYYNTSWSSYYPTNDQEGSFETALTDPLSIKATQANSSEGIPPPPPPLPFETTEISPDGLLKEIVPIPIPPPPPRPPRVDVEG
ncbi:hypothetical protein K7432_005514 [Basidiobolus ranarum]|uniref:CCHC-type domain-containing protein n=1 Tax=Basidiobolus ranarum TaxID=34480 RepID=A0ABR2WWK5_9FUNG